MLRYRLECAMKIHALLVFELDVLHGVKIRVISTSHTACLVFSGHLSFVRRSSSLGYIRLENG